jgi:hypothetical protein
MKWELNFLNKLSSNCQVITTVIAIEIALPLESLHQPK